MENSQIKTWAEFYWKNIVTIKSKRINNKTYFGNWYELSLQKIRNSSKKKKVKQYRPLEILRQNGKINFIFSLWWNKFFTLVIWAILLLNMIRICHGLLYCLMNSTSNQKWNDFAKFRWQKALNIMIIQPFTTIKSGL